MQKKQREKRKGNLAFGKVFAGLGKEGGGSSVKYKVLQYTVQYKHGDITVKMTTEDLGFETEYLE